VTKETENYDQLLDRFKKRKEQLIAEQNQLRDAAEKFGRIVDDLERLEGSIQAIEYLKYGALPSDGNHDGMADHQPT